MWPERPALCSLAQPSHGFCATGATATHSAWQHGLFWLISVQNPFDCRPAFGAVPYWDAALTGSIHGQDKSRATLWPQCSSQRQVHIWHTSQELVLPADKAFFSPHAGVESSLQLDKFGAAFPESPRFPEMALDSHLVNGTPNAAQSMMMHLDGVHSLLHPPASLFNTNNNAALGQHGAGVRPLPAGPLPGTTKENPLQSVVLWTADMGPMPPNLSTSQQLLQPRENSAQAMLPEGTPVLDAANVSLIQLGPNGPAATSTQLPTPGSGNAVAGEAGNPPRGRSGRKHGTGRGTRPPRGPRPSNCADRDKDRSSKYRGVTKHKRSGRYESHIWVKELGRQVYLGGYECEEHAAEAYDIAALKSKGARTTTNFDIEKYADLLVCIDRMSMEELVMAVRRQSQGFSRGTSTFRGVTHHPSGRWEARIGVPGAKHIYLGLFAEEKDAAKAYDRALVRLRGRSAATNFAVAEYRQELGDFHK